MFVDTSVRPQGERVSVKLSALVRECGYGNTMDYHECVLGRAYTKITGRSLLADGIKFREQGNSAGRHSHFVKVAARAFGVADEIADKVECMCLRECAAETIADWLEAQGL